MNNETVQDEISVAKHRKTYFWILFLSTLGFWLGSQITNLIDKFFIKCPVNISSSSFAPPCGVGLAGEHKPFHTTVLVLMATGSLIGFAVELIKKSKTNIVVRIVGYLIIIPTFLLYLWGLFFEVPFFRFSLAALTNFIPLIIILGLCFIRKIIPSK